jgi:hypothetical protein
MRLVRRLALPAAVRWADLVPMVRPFLCCTVRERAPWWHLTWFLLGHSVDYLPYGLGGNAHKHRRGSVLQLGRRRARALLSRLCQAIRGLRRVAALHVAAVLFFSQSFALAVVHYLPAAAFLLASLLVAYGRRREPHLLPGIAGLLLSFMAAAIQQTEARIPSLQLSHNALYHLVQAVALLMIFFTARGLTMEALCERDANS